MSSKSGQAGTALNQVKKLRRRGNRMSEKWPLGDSLWVMEKVSRAFFCWNLCWFKQERMPLDWVAVGWATAIPELLWTSLVKNRGQWWGKGGSQHPTARSGGQWVYYTEHPLPGPCRCWADIHLQGVPEGSNKMTNAPSPKLWTKNVYGGKKK